MALSRSPSLSGYCHVHLWILPCLFHLDPLPCELSSETTFSFVMNIENATLSFSYEKSGCAVKEAEAGPGRKGTRMVTDIPNTLPSLSLCLPPVSDLATLFLQIYHFFLLPKYVPNPLLFFFF